MIEVLHSSREGKETYKLELDVPPCFLMQTHAKTSTFSTLPSMNIQIFTWNTCADEMWTKFLEEAMAQNKVEGKENVT